MINKQKVIAVIPARGGSKSLHKKNLKKLNGLPLVAWSIKLAQQVEEIDHVIVSTDDPKIAAVASNYAAEVSMRPLHLATDESLVIDTLRDLYQKIEFEKKASDIMILLEPTCPLRGAEDVKAALVKLVNENLDSVASFKPANLNPCRAWCLDDASPRPFIDKADPWQPRQELPEAYQLNGAVYAFYINRLSQTEKGLLFGKCGAIKMPNDRSVDIDTEIDFVMAELLVGGRDV